MKCSGVSRNLFEPEKIGVPPVAFGGDAEQPFESAAEVIGIDITAPSGDLRNGSPGGE